jgi:hypothetical protein
MVKKKTRKVRVKKVVPLGNDVHHVELEIHGAPDLPNVELPAEPIEMPEAAQVQSGEVEAPLEVPAHHRHWYDWLVKAFS